MRNEIKILKFLRDYQKPIGVKEICERLHLDNDEETMRIIRHLRNQELVVLYREEGRVGVLHLEADPVTITTNGIKHLENRIPVFIKSYVPLVISIVALAVAIVALIV